MPLKKFEKDQIGSLILCGIDDVFADFVICDFDKGSAIGKLILLEEDSRSIISRRIYPGEYVGLFIVQVGRLLVTTYPRAKEAGVVLPTLGQMTIEICLPVVVPDTLTCEVKYVNCGRQGCPSGLSATVHNARNDRIAHARFSLPLMSERVREHLIRSKDQKVEG
jgi:hypothetical protein